MGDDADVGEELAATADEQEPATEQVTGRPHPAA
jgi:hypothetical protein